MRLSPISLAITRGSSLVGSGGSAAFSPTSLFAASEEGAFYDFSNLATLRQNSYGVGAVTDYGDPVGFVLDQSKGSSTFNDLGPELLPNPDFTTDISRVSGGGTQSRAWDNGALVITNAGAFNNVVFELYDFQESGAPYLFEIEVSEINLDGGGAIDAFAHSGAGTNYYSGLFSSPGTYSCVLIPTSGAAQNMQVAFPGGSVNSSMRIERMSYRKLPGNHLTQSTSTARPLLARVPVGGRRNLIPFSEALTSNPNYQFGAAQTTVTLMPSEVAPDGSTGNVYRIQMNAASGSFVTLGAASVRTVSVYAKQYSGASDFGIFLQNGGTSGTQNRFTAGADWQRFDFSAASAASGNYGINNTDDSYAVDVLVWGYQAETSAAVTNYQKVTAAYDITESGKADVVGLYFDKTDDHLISASIDFSGTDNATIAASLVPSNSTDNSQRLITHEEDSTSHLRTNVAGSAKVVQMGSGAGVIRTATMPYEYYSPTYFVGRADISDPIVKIQGSGASGESAAGQGSGNYAKNAVYIGRNQNGGFNWYQGFLMNALLIDRYITDEETTELETYLEDKAGVE
jgi:hypothetical protein